MLHFLVICQILIKNPQNRCNEIIATEKLLKNKNVAETCMSLPATGRLIVQKTPLYKLIASTFAINKNYILMKESLFNFSS